MSRTIYDGMPWSPPAEPPDADTNHRVPLSLSSRLLTRSALATLPAPAPLIDGTIDLGTVVVLAGYWGTLKSFIAQDWAASVATSRPWMGRPTVSRRVLYVAAEGAYGLNERITAWEKAWHRTVEDSALTVLPVPAHLGHQNDVLELEGIIRAGKYGFVVVDTLAKCMPGMDENSAKDMGIAVSALYSLMDATGGGTVNVLHHTGKDKSTVRGSSALEGGVDCVYQTEGDANCVTLSRKKRKDGPVTDELRLRFAPVKGTTSGNVEAFVDIDTNSRRNTAAEALYSHFVSHHGATGASTTQLLASSEMPSTSFYRALNVLVTEGRLVNVGKSGRSHYVLPA
ncbi:AAA family ATPase [Georgenia sp. AZ-5]|uniref:AAA family ATPase n=1 Tax=Georgenia sp. AZ-5 TaxID=3367526 RepID=UPI0037541FC6